MHGAAKTLALIGADRVAQATGSRDLRPLGGLAPRMPRTALGFGLAVLTLAAMPPFGGFVSEWFTLEALLQSFRLGSTIARLTMALGAAMLALTAGIGLLAFAKLYGGIFLGRARSAVGHVREPRNRRRVPRPGRRRARPRRPRAVGDPLARPRPRGRPRVRSLHDAIGSRSCSGPSTSTSPSSPRRGSRSASRRSRRVVGGARSRRPPPTRAPRPGLGLRHRRRVGSHQYTPDSYANPIRVVLAGAYRFARDARAGGRPATATAGARTRVVPAFEEYLYRPLTRAALRPGLARGYSRAGSASTSSTSSLVLLAALALIPALHAR